MSVTASTDNPVVFARSLSDFFKMPTPASVMINVGDLLWNNAGVVAVASTFTWAGSLALTQSLFREKFLGVAADKKLAADPSTRNIRIARTCVCNYAQVSTGSLHVGQSFAPDKDPAGNNLLDQVVVAVSDAETFMKSIGTLDLEAAAGALNVEVRIQSFMTVSKNSDVF